MFDADVSAGRSVNVLLAVDEVQALFMTSEYRSPDFTLLESYALSLPRLLLDYISGRKAFVSAIFASIFRFTRANTRFS